MRIAAAEAGKPRLLVMTDVGGDPDDQQSLVRLLHYANEFDIEGLIATASGTPGELKQKVTRPDLIREVLSAYGGVQMNLKQHADGYPAAEVLLACVKAGNPERGKNAVGERRDTEGSRWIIAAADKSDPRPLCISIWGGQTDLAQSLWRVRSDRGEAGLKSFVSRLRIYDIADQDGIAAWIQEEFWLPALASSSASSHDCFYIQAGAMPGRDKREGVFRGMYLGGDISLVSRDWMETNIRQNHGPLGALYPPQTWTAPNPHSAIKEGDTPSWFYFLPHGLNDPAHPDWGGWGGRFEHREKGIYRDAQDTVNGVTEARAGVWRWREAFQADFQARLNWAVTPQFIHANHAPRAVLNGDAGHSIRQLAVNPGTAVKLSASGSSDPDKQELNYRWFVYAEAGTYRGQVALTESHSPTTDFTAPAVSLPATVHIILQVTDNGRPALSSFRRAIVTIDPESN